ncbi:class I SAM-dependent methyltransferase [Candidatus Dojkabacteria bacterium]|nr:class I SAM-dependent methyltransferase [Candidatus Dojkabacteria bacterium]
MDEVYKYNLKRWESLAAANALFTKPVKDLTKKQSREYIDPENILGKIEGKQVLCLAGGGGQQSIAFALLGADVTVFDISPAQLDKDLNTSRKYNVELSIQQGDMRDLSCFGKKKFDIIYQPFSLNFVPDCSLVFREVSRITKSRGIYTFMCSNPFFTGITEKNWNGKGIVLNSEYKEGEKVSYSDQDWVFTKSTKSKDKINPPVEYRQTLSKLINSLYENAFTLFHLTEYISETKNPKKGSWEYLTKIAPPWLTFWTRRK